jgi:hypothetical protein
VPGRHHLRRGRAERAASVDVLESGGLLGGPVGAGPDAVGGAALATVHVTHEGDIACGRPTCKEYREFYALPVVPGDLDGRACVRAIRATSPRHASLKGPRPGAPHGSGPPPPPPRPGRQPCRSSRQDRTGTGSSASTCTSSPQPAAGLRAYPPTSIVRAPAHRLTPEDRPQPVRARTSAQPAAARSRTAELPERSARARTMRARIPRRR